MRKQYHFMPSDRGVRAWDVDRLIELSRDLPRSSVDPASLRELDEIYWFDEDKPPTCRRVLEHMRLIEEVDFTHPIILGADGRVMDGMHRVAKALLQNRNQIEAVQFERDPEPDYVNVKASELDYSR